MAWAIVDESGKVINLIEYDGVSPYVVDEGFSLLQVPEGTRTQAEIDAIVNIPRHIDPITTRQFLIAAALGGLITEQEALDAATSGAIPSAIAVAFNALPADQAFGARVTWAKMTLIERNEPLVAAAAAALGMTEEQIEGFFIQAATL